LRTNRETTPEGFHDEILSDHITCKREASQQVNAPQSQPAHEVARVRGLVNLYCWAHIRRYFVRAGDANPAQLKYWTAAWLERIKVLYATHAQLMAAWEDAAAPAPRETPAAAARLEEAGAAWDEALAVIDEARKKQMAAPGLQEPAKKALATLDREWDGLAAHRGYPMIGLDNNPAERAIRRPVVTRKNAYGSNNDDAARLAARVWTVTATAEMAGLNVPGLPHRLSRRLRAERRQAAIRPGPGTIPALARSSRRPPRLGTAAGPRITPPKQPQKRRPTEYGHAAS
jgi:hypothetical protein